MDRRALWVAVAALVPQLGAAAQTRPSPQSIARLAAGWDTNAVNWTRHDTTVLGLSTEGTRVVTWRPDDGSLAKVLVESLGEMGRASQTYYFARGWGLCLVVSRADTYDAPLSGHVVSTQLDSLYYDGQRLVRGISVDSSSAGMHAKPLKTSRDSTEAELNETLRAAGVRRGA